MTILAACLFALAQGDPSLEARVSTYASQLREETTRDRARDRLIHLGKPALALLEKTDADPALLASIRQEVALNDSLGSSYGPPHTFTLDGTEESLGVLLSRLEAVAGAPFQKNNLDLGQKLSVKLDDATFWEALDEICTKAAIWYYPTNDPIYLNGGMASLKPRCYYGPIMVVMDRVSQQRRITFSAIESEFTIQLTTVWEKSIVPLGANGRYRLTAVTDDTGASLIPAARPQPASTTRAGGLVRPNGQSIALNGLRPPSPQAKKLTRVEGTLELEFPSRVDEVRFELVADGPTPAREKSVEGVKVELKNFTPQAAWGASMTIALRFSDPKEAAEFRIGTADVEYIMANDQKRYGWIGSAKFEDGVYSFVTNWRNGGRQELPKEIHLRIPRGGVMKIVPFCFKEVELK